MAQKLFILKLEPDLDPKPEKLCEHGAWCIHEHRPTLPSVILGMHVVG